MGQELVAFNAEGNSLLAVVAELSDEDLAKPTNCPPWNLAELLVHIAGSIRVGTLADAPTNAIPHETADYYRRPERNTAEYRDRNVLQTQQAARQLRPGLTTNEYLSRALDDTSSRMASENLDRLVDIKSVGPMRIGDWLATRVIALAAHGLDVAISLDIEPWTTSAASDLMRPIFRSLVGRQIPAELSWTDRRLLETATGRARLTGDERSVLGADADRFPLLS